MREGIISASAASVAIDFSVQLWIWRVMELFATILLPFLDRVRM
jgi:hypothetical protein